jgi:predicted methyltransferase
MMFAEYARSIAAMTFGFFALLGATAGASAQSAPDYAALLAAPDRSDADRQADNRRDPLPFLAFAGVRPGMKALDMGAGGGYSTEMLARAVAPGGVVYGQNPPDLFEKPKATFEARLKTPAMKDAWPTSAPSTIRRRRMRTISTSSRFSSSITTPLT